MKMIELQASVKSFLKTFCPRVRLENASEDDTFPYVVFNIPDAPSDMVMLEVDVWDDKQDFNVLENLTDAIDGDGKALDPSGLNRKIIKGNSFQAYFIRKSRLPIPDEDKKYHRRQLRYSVKIY